jgi:hypothetical protein
MVPQNWPPNVRIAKTFAKKDLKFQKTRQKKTQKCMLRQTQFETNPYFLKSIRDYAERVQPAMNNEAQLDQFGNPRDLSLEGSSVQSYDAQSLLEYRAGRITREDLNRIKVFMSHLSDCSDQEAGTTYNNMGKEYAFLKAAGELFEDSTVDLNNTDGCTAQYRSFRALFLLSMLAFRFQIIIDRAVGAPGHGKDEVDRLNAVDKRYLQSKMRLTETAGADESDHKMKSYAMVENENFSLAEECHRILTDQTWVDGVKGDAKHAKRKARVAKEGDETDVFRTEKGRRPAQVLEIHRDCQAWSP